jgi:hypothetical protein
MVTAYNVKKDAFYRVKGDSRREGFGVMELWDGLMTVKIPNGCMNIRYCDAEELEVQEGDKLYEYPHPVEDRRTVLGWFYHDPSDCIFIAQINADHGAEESFVHYLGECREGTEIELLEILCSMPHWENQDITKYSIIYDKPDINN